MKKITFFIVVVSFFLTGRVAAQGGTEPVLGEIRMVAFPFAPRGWALCNGQLLPINVNQALFSILGTTYGGDGRTTFGLPDLRGRAAVHPGTTYSLGQSGGEENHSLSVSEIPPHNHSKSTVSTELGCNNGEGNTSDPTDHFPAVNTSRGNEYSSTANGSSGVISTVGISTKSVGIGYAHNNLQPYTVVNYIIALSGLYPVHE